MSIDGFVLPLLSAPLFASLDPRKLKSIALIAQKVVFDDGVDLIRDGEAGDAAYVIAAGNVAVRSPDIEGDVEIRLGPGTIVGELAMFVDMVHETSVTAIGEVHALRIERASLLQLMAEDTNLSAAFVEVMRQRLEALATRLKEADELLDLDVVELAHPAASHH